MKNYRRPGLWMIGICLDTLMVLIFSIWTMSVHLWTRRFGLLLFKFGRMDIYMRLILQVLARFQTFDNYMSNENGFNFVFGFFAVLIRSTEIWKWF
ncbi:hypothetical protein RCL_jg19951.t1 [Rhizophagus clarus]|uniref:Uncharacterized protein n=1 Tax=Rhizophagus clarus TaxID=94130 RepID=A0A8H3LCG1_9GLOM|nr:hypothetical protein RCL_jg19951.t1 [Rhizophagus clarus]